MISSHLQYPVAEVREQDAEALGILFQVLHPLGHLRGAWDRSRVDGPDLSRRDLDVKRKRGGWEEGC